MQATARNLEQQEPWLRGERELLGVVRFSGVPSNFQVLRFDDHENL